MEHFNPILGSEPNGQKFITCGEIMLRLTPPNYEKIRMASAFEASYGGSEANIALALANLGVDSTFFSVVPNNSLGKSAVRWLRSNDVHCTPHEYCYCWFVYLTAQMDVVSQHPRNHNQIGRAHV